MFSLSTTSENCKLISRNKIDMRRFFRRIRKRALSGADFTTSLYSFLIIPLKRLVKRKRSQPIRIIRMLKAKLEKHILRGFILNSDKSKRVHVVVCQDLAHCCDEKTAKSFAHKFFSNLKRSKRTSLKSQTPTHQLVVFIINSDVRIPFD